MTTMRGSVSTVLAAVIGAAVMAAPATAVADPAEWPSPGSQPASDTLQALERLGYAVGINWLDGSKAVPLERCRVTGYHAPNRSGDTDPAATTVYMDVICPYED